MHVVCWMVVGATLGALSSACVSDDNVGSELADASGVSLRTITRLEGGGRAGLDTVRQLTEALEVKPADLMGQPPETN